MQFDRQLIRQATRLAPKLLAQLTKKRAPAGQEPTPEEAQAEAIKADPRNDPDLRGSGSWANEWAGAKHAVERAKDFATNGRKPARVKSRMLEMPEIPEGSIRPRALMTAREVKLHNWIADRMELAAPTCSLHSGVALSAFLASDTIGALDGLVADMVIANEAGDPVAVLVRDRKDDNARQIRLLDALIDSELPVIDLPDRISLSKLWGDIEMALPDDANEDAA